MVHPPCTPVTPALVRGRVTCAGAVKAPRSIVVADADVAKGFKPRTRRTPVEQGAIFRDRGRLRHGSGAGASPGNDGRLAGRPLEEARRMGRDERQSYVCSMSCM